MPGLVNVDFADVRAIMAGAGSSLMGQGTASGPERAKQVCVCIFARTRRTTNQLRRLPNYLRTFSIAQT